MYISKMSFKKFFKANTILFYSFLIILQTSKYHYFPKFLTDRPEQTDEPCHEKTNIFHMRKQRRKSASR